MHIQCCKFPFNYEFVGYVNIVTFTYPTNSDKFYFLLGQNIDI